MPSISERSETTAGAVFCWFERGCVTAVTVIPFLLGVAHLASTSVWRDDLPLLRGLAWVGASGSGGLSAMLVEASFFLPLGSVHFRAGLCFPGVLAASSYVVFRFARALLDRAAPTPRLAVALAAIAALLTP